MSRVAKNPVSIPTGVEISINERIVAVKGAKGSLEMALHPSVSIIQEEGRLRLAPVSEKSEYWAMAGTMRALVNNMVTGVSKGFERKLVLVGVGYRAQSQGKVLTLTRG